MLSSVWSISGEFRNTLRTVCVCLTIFTGGLAGAAASAATPATAPALCGAIRAQLDAEAGGAPVFLVSYPALPGLEPLPPGLVHSAFSYDNALAAISLVACGQTRAAERIGQALLTGVNTDRSFNDGRIRNAYRAGPAGRPPLPPGWWDAKAGRWEEDPSQNSSSTGNVAWVALAMLTLDEATAKPDASAHPPVPGQRPYLDAAVRLMAWVADLMADPIAPAGFDGGVDGFDATQQRLSWKSTEHNIDAAAAFAWLARRTGEARWSESARMARGFVAAQWQADDGHFRIGTQGDGRSPNLSVIALDTQVWPLLAFPDAPVDWRRSLKWAETHMAAEGGFDFNDDRDGRWPEGTAQAALVYRMLGNGGEVARLLGVLGQDVAPDGLLYAASHDGLTTGLAVGSSTGVGEFLYYRRPHLGATAWAILAATGWNPFTGQRFPVPRA